MDLNNLTDADYRKIDFYEGKNKLVRHFKGDLYLIVDFAENTETLEQMVIYRALYGDCKLYARPINMFVEECTPEQYEEYGQKYRFERVKAESVRK